MTAAMWLATLIGFLFGVSAGMWHQALADRRRRRRIVAEQLRRVARTYPVSGGVLVTSAVLSERSSARLRAEFRARMLARHPECPVCNPRPAAPTAGVS